MSDNIAGGYMMDASVVYGPSTFFAVPGAGEQQTVDSTPLGGAQAPSTGGLTARSFLRSPAGLLLILVPLAYLAFHKTFGNG